METGETRLHMVLGIFKTDFTVILISQSWIQGELDTDKAI